MTWTYTPTPDADGFDSAVTNIRIRFSGAMNASGVDGNPWASVRFRVGVR